MKNVEIRERGIAIVPGVLLAAVVLMYALPIFATAQRSHLPDGLPLSMSKGGNKVGLRWRPSPGAKEYRVLRSEKSGHEYEEIAMSPQPQVMDDAVVPGSTYYYVLQSVAGGAESVYSSEMSVTVPVKEKVFPPMWVCAVATASLQHKVVYKVGLLWAKVPGATAYNVYRRSDQEREFELILSTSDSQGGDTDIRGGTTYHYAVTALDAAFEETPFSEEKTVEVKKYERKKGVRLKPLSRKMKPLWRRGESDGQELSGFRELSDIAFDETSNILIASSAVAAELYFLNADTGEVEKVVDGIGGGDGKFLDIRGVETDRKGNVYVVDAGKAAINAFTGRGVFSRQVEIPLSDYDGALEKPPLFWDVACDRDNGDFYVLDMANSCIWVLDREGAFLRLIGKSGYREKEMKGPVALRFTPDGRHLAVASMIPARLSFFTREGDFVRTWGKNKLPAGGSVTIRGFDFDAEGNVLVVDQVASLVAGFLPDGRYLYHVAGGSSLELSGPRSVVFGSKNRFFVVESLPQGISAYQMTGEAPPPQELVPADRDWGKVVPCPEDSDRHWREILKTDVQYLLAEAALENGKEYIRRKAAEKLSDQSLLAKVVVEASDPAVRAAAASLLDDQPLLGDVALGDRNINVRERAVERLTDQDQLARIVLESKDPHLRWEAVRLVTDQLVFAEVAFTEEDSRIRRYAAAKLGDISLKERIALEDPDGTVREAAVFGLTDQATLTKIALEDENKDARAEAAKKLTDQAVLARIALEDTHPKVRYMAVSQLDDQGVLEKVARMRLLVRAKAITKVEDQALLAEIADGDDDWRARWAAVTGLTDQELLGRIALEDESEKVREEAASRVKVLRSPP